LKLNLNRALATRLLCGLLGLSILTACQGTSATIPTPPNPSDLLDHAGETIQTTKFVKIKLQASGAPVYINTVGAGAVQFLSADGAYAAPDRASAVVKAKLLGVSGQVDIVSIGDGQWYRNAILTGGKFLPSQFAPGFNAAKLVSSDQGIRSALQSVTGITLVGRENMFGTDVFHLKGKADGSKVTSLTVGLIQSTTSVDIDVYIDTATYRAIRVVMVQPETVSATQPKPTTWDLELYDYDQPVTIDSPADAAGSGATTVATDIATTNPTLGVASTP